MRVSSIQNYGLKCGTNCGTKRRMSPHRENPVNTEPQKGDSISFQSKAGASALGAAIGGALGAAAITFISGGLAIPFVVGAYTIGGAAIGAGAGSVLGDDDKPKPDDKND